MKIKHVSRMAGPDGVYHPGTVREIDDATGAQLIAGGYAVNVDPPKETADVVADQVEEPDEPAPKPEPKPAPKQRSRKPKAGE